VVALLLHVPFFPTDLALWLERALRVADVADEPDAEVILPIDLDLLAGSPSDESSGPALSTAGGGATDAVRPAGERDAGPDAAEAPGVEDGGTIDAGRPRAVLVPPDAGVDDAGAVPPDAGAPRLRDPVTAAGNVGRITSRDPSVQVLIAGDRLRKHELGPLFSELVTSIPEWASFFHGTPIDPIRDLDHLLLAGPRFVGDSSKLVAVMDYNRNLTEAQVRQAIDGVVKATGGYWLDDAPLPAALATAAGLPRLFALLPGQRLVFVLPVDAKADLGKLKATRGFNRSSPVGIAVSLLNPARPLTGVFELPPAIRWLRLALTPTADGGADVAVELGDRSAAEAKTHAVEIGAAFERARKVSLLGLASMTLLDPIPFAADGEIIRGRGHATNRQLRSILGFAASKFTPPARR
jgi:hypothetical protein